MKECTTSQGNHTKTETTIKIIPKIVLCSFVIFTLFIGVLQADETSKEKMSEKPKELRVLTFNIHVGIGMDNKFDLERTAKVIKDLDPDFVALQEVDRFAARSGKIDHLAELEKLTGMSGVFGKTVDHSPSGEYGIAILSKHPIREHKFTQFPEMENQENRGLLQINVKFSDDTELTFASTHFCHISETRRVEQAEKINEILSQGNTIAIIGGDFNARSNSESITLLKKHWTDATDGTPSFSSTNPRSKIDYIFYRPEKALKLKETKVIEDKITSDHRPVLSVLEWTDK